MSAMAVVGYYEPWWIQVLKALVIFVVALALTRIVSLASLLACVAMPIFASLHFPVRRIPSLPVVFSICVLIVIRHGANLARLMRGEEPALVTKRGAPKR